MVSENRPITVLRLNIERLNKMKPLNNYINKANDNLIFHTPSRSQTIYQAVKALYGAGVMKRFYVSVAGRGSHLTIINRRTAEGTEYYFDGTKLHECEY